jgi:hypothetical protein
MNDDTNIVPENSLDDLLTAVPPLRRGRRQTISDAELEAARNYLYRLLENTWGVVGWNL